MKGDNMTRKGRRKAKRASGKWQAKRSDDQPPTPTAERQAGSPTTHYQPKPVQWALAAQKLAKAGWTTKKIAKRLGVSAKEVEFVLSGRAAASDGRRPSSPAPSNQAQRDQPDDREGPR